MKYTSLNGTWRMTGHGFDCEGQIPGSLFSFLLANGLMEDPYYRDNELKALALTHADYTFTRTFSAETDGKRRFLRFEGLDTLCDVYLNGRHLATTDNMHVTYELDVTEVLADGENTLSVVCHDVHPYIKEKVRDVDLFENIQALAGFGYIRKAHCMLGWDWGPFLPDMGVWRSVTLIEADSARITDFKLEQRHEGGRVFIRPLVKTDMPCEVRLTLTDPDGVQTVIAAQEQTEVTAPRLWWPRGLGEQPLYTVTAEILSADGSACDVQSRRIGLRTLELIREKDRYGESFKHRCNGLEFFAMGADYIPEDNIFSRCTEERSRALLELCADANFNAIRVWGGGYYPDNYFFDICDELGLIVFFDLAFACTLYLPDEAQLASIRTEVRQNLMRLRHHASLAVVCGNNELEACHFGLKGTPLGNRILPINIELFEGVIADIAREVCPEIPYIHTSPITVGHFTDPNNENFGDSHYWDVWHHGKPFSEYRNHHFRYLSEFGFQSFPNEKTVNAVTLPEDRNIFSRVMERHQRNAGANSKIISYLSQTYLYPNSFGTLIYASQLLQAEAMRYGVEHLRRERGRCMGTLYWQLNDIWPVASWASIDYYGRLKALQYYAKRFYAPVLLSCRETGETTTRPFVIMEPDYYDYETKTELTVTNDTRTAVDGEVVEYMRDMTGRVLKEQRFSVHVDPLSVVTLPETDWHKTDVLETYISYELHAGGQLLSEGTVLFTAPKHVCFRDPHLSVRVEGDELVVTATAYAKSVEIYSDTEDLYLSDNFFDMNGGEKRVKVLSGRPEGLRVRSVYDIK